MGTIFRLIICLQYFENFLIDVYLELKFRTSCPKRTSGDPEPTSVTERLWTLCRKWSCEWLVDCYRQQCDAYYMTPCFTSRMPNFFFRFFECMTEEKGANPWFNAAINNLQKTLIWAVDNQQALHRSVFITVF